MPANNYLPDVLETTEAERLATGFIFTEGPLWHPGGYWYFVDLRQNKLFRLTPGKEPEVVRNTIGGNGTTFDLQGRLVVCEGDDRRLTRMDADGKVQSLVDNYKGGRFNRPNDVVCHSNGCLYFTDPDKRRPYNEREISGPEGDNNLWDGACIYRLAPDGQLERARALRIPERARAVAGRAHDVCGQHALLAIHPRDQAPCRRHVRSTRRCLRLCSGSISTGTTPTGTIPTGTIPTGTMAPLATAALGNSSRRHLNSWLVLTLWRRATIDTDDPGSSVSATIWRVLGRWRALIRHSQAAAK